MPKSRVIRDEVARLDPATTKLPPRAPVTEPIPHVPRFDDPDERTPLFDALWAMSGMGGRHVLNPDREVPAVGRHYDENDDGLADHDKPAATAGEEDHSDPWVFAGEDAGPPEVA